jgi:anti-sigma regulatory factor (Ser/Thr protein kinase)
LKDQRKLSTKIQGFSPDPVITIPAVFSRQTLPSVLGNLHYLITVRRDRNIVLDFSSCQRVFEAGMLPLMPVLGRYRAINKVHFALILPKDDRVSGLFRRSNWANLIDPFKYEYDENPTGSHCPAIRFSTSDEQFSAVDNILNVVMNSMTVTRDVMKAIEWSVNEITDNVINHSGSHPTGYVQATWFRENNVVEFVVADAGMGISKSLGINDNRLALERAIQEGVTRNSNTNQENSLYGSFQIARAAQGIFNLYSRFATLSLTQDQEVMIRQEKVPYPGTAVRWNMRTDASGVISKALKFKGESHEISFDYLDRFDIDGEIIINVKEQFVSLGSRDAGHRALTFLRNVLTSSGDAIVLDFDNVNIVSSSFADEVLGRLFVELGPMVFMTRIKFKNADKETLSLIDRAIIQRSGMGNPASGNTRT